MKICWQDYYKDLSNTAIRDTIYINPHNSDVLYSNISEEDLFFKRKEKHFSPNSSDSTIQEFYSLNEVQGECINGDYFRRKSLKMYSRGKPNGIWIYYNKQGEMTRRTEYENGVIVSDKVY